MGWIEILILIVVGTTTTSTTTSTYTQVEQEQPADNSGSSDNNVTINDNPVDVVNVLPASDLNNPMIGLSYTLDANNNATNVTTWTYDQNVISEGYSFPNVDPRTEIDYISLNGSSFLPPGVVISSLLADTVTYRSGLGSTFTVGEDIANPDEIIVFYRDEEHFQELGVWNGSTTTSSTGQNLGFFSFGELSDLATITALSGNATYAGWAKGGYIDASGNVYNTNATASITADFTNNSALFSLTGTTGTDLNQSSANLSSLNVTNAALSIGTSANTLNGSGETAGGLDGNVYGVFYGPQAEEVGGTFLFRADDQTQNYVGNFGATSTTLPDAVCGEFCQRSVVDYYDDPSNENVLFIAYQTWDPSTVYKVRTHMVGIDYGLQNSAQINTSIWTQANWPLYFGVNASTTLDYVGVPGHWNPNGMSILDGNNGDQVQYLNVNTIGTAYPGLAGDEYILANSGAATSDQLKFYFVKSNGINYQDFGLWVDDYQTSTFTNRIGFFSWGQETPYSLLPTRGYASYLGDSVGQWINADGASVDTVATTRLYADFLNQEVHFFMNNTRNQATGASLSNLLDVENLILSYSSSNHNPYGTGTNKAGDAGEVSAYFYGPPADLEIGGNFWFSGTNAGDYIGAFGATATTVPDLSLNATWVSNPNNITFTDLTNDMSNSVIGGITDQTMIANAAYKINVHSMGMLFQIDQENVGRREDAQSRLCNFGVLCEATVSTVATDPRQVILANWPMYVAADASGNLALIHIPGQGGPAGIDRSKNDGIYVWDPLATQLARSERPLGDAEFHQHTVSDQGGVFSFNRANETDVNRRYPYTNQQLHDDQIYIYTNDTFDFDYQDFGFWTDLGYHGLTRMYFTFGQETAAASIPSNGSATYTGKSVGMYLRDVGVIFDTQSDVSANIDFSNQLVNLSLTNTTGTSETGYSTAQTVDLSSYLDATFQLTYGYENHLFGGGFNNEGLNGNIEAWFYGPNAEGLGGTFQFIDVYTTEEFRDGGNESIYTGSFASNQTATSGITTYGLASGSSNTSNFIDPNATLVARNYTIISPGTTVDENYTKNSVTVSGQYTANTLYGIETFATSIDMLHERITNRFFLRRLGASSPQNVIYIGTNASNEVDYLGFETQINPTGVSVYAPNENETISEIQRLGVTVTHAENTSENGNPNSITLFYGDQDDLSYVDYGMWQDDMVTDNTTTRMGVLLFNASKTIPSEIPTTGTANYNGHSTGYYIDENSYLYYTASDIAASLDFANQYCLLSSSNTIGIAYEGTQQVSLSTLDFSNIALNYTWVNSDTMSPFRGNIETFDWCNGCNTNVEAFFMGPNAVELGGYWTISDYTSGQAYLGAFGAGQ